MNTAPARPTLGEAFTYWLKLGPISFGGRAGQISIMHQELMEKRRWISEHRYLHAINDCMLLPGPEGTQLAIYISWLMHGIRGGIIAGVLFFLFILAGGSVVEATRGEIRFTAPLTGITAAVIGVILKLAAFFTWHTFWPQGTAEAPFAGSFDWLSVIVAVASFVALWRYKADIMKVIGVFALLGLAYSFLM